MMERISIVCFASSYLISLACEVGRLFFRAPVRWLVSVGFAGAGWVAHTLYLGMELKREYSGAPLSSWYHWFLLAAWLLAGLYVVQAVRRPKMAWGLFLLPLVLALIGLGYASRGLKSFSAEDASLYWGLMHGMSLLAGTVSVSVGFVSGVMYLIQAWRLKSKVTPWQGMQLPSLESLQRVNERALIVSAIFLGIGLIAGWLLNVVRHQGVPWSDPVVVTSFGLFAWIVASSVFNGFYRPAREGRKVAYLTVASFLFLAVVLGLVALGPSAHTQGGSGQHSTWRPGLASQICQGVRAPGGAA